MGRKSKELSPDKKEVIVNLKWNVQDVVNTWKYLQVSYQDYERKSFEKARRFGRQRKMSARTEARLKRLVKKKTVEKFWGI